MHVRKLQYKSILAFSYMQEIQLVCFQLTAVYENLMVQYDYYWPCIILFLTMHIHVQCISCVTTSTQFALCVFPVHGHNYACTGSTTACRRHTWQLIYFSADCKVCAMICHMCDDILTSLCPLHHCPLDWSLKAHFQLEQEECLDLY